MRTQRATVPREAMEGADTSMPETGRLTKKTPPPPPREPAAL